MMGDRPTAAILGLGSYVPQNTLTNQDFEKTLDTTDEWITTRTGIKERRIAGKDQVLSDLSVAAARLALEDAHFGAVELDLILSATVTPDYLFPASACVIQEKLGVSHLNIPSFDLMAACSGFLYGLGVAKAFVESGMYRKILVVGGETLSRIIDYQDRSTCILFGDAAGAAVVGVSEPGSSGHIIRSVNLWADGRGVNLLVMPGGGSAQPTTHETVEGRQHFIKAKGREVFRFAVQRLVEMVESLMAKHALKPQDLGAIIPHQANLRIIDAAAQRLGFPLDMFIINIQKYANTSSASVPLALDEAHRAGRLVKGKPVIIMAFGAGLTWGSALLEW